jgi:hypothetical protein
MPSAILGANEWPEDQKVLGYNLLRRNLTGSWITPDEENKIEVKSVKLVKSENDMILQIGRWE